MKQLRRSDLTARPWRNGGGRTWDVAVFPQGAGFEDMLWRLSLAEVASDGPFSAFPGMDRTLTVLSGGGIALDFAEGGTVTLDPAAAPFGFPGEAALCARLTGEPIIDLNIMTARRACRHHVDMLTEGEAAPEGTIALVARSGPASVAGRSLAPGDILLGDPDRPLAGVRAQGPLLAIAVQWLR